MTEWTRESNPVDRELDFCLNQAENQSTAGMTGCQADAYKAWDTELNSVFKQIMNSELSPAEKAQFRQDQKNWLSFRDSELNFIDNVYEHTQGTIHVPMQAGDRTSLVKDRVIQLHQRLDMIGDGK